MFDKGFTIFLTEKVHTMTMIQSQYPNHYYWQNINFHNLHGKAQNILSCFHKVFV